MSICKSDLIGTVAMQSGVPADVVKNVVTTTLNEMFLALTEGQDVVLGRIGKLKVKVRAKRLARNPMRPGETYEIPAVNTVKLKLSSEIKAKLIELPLVVREKRKSGFARHPQYASWSQSRLKPAPQPSPASHTAAPGSA